MYAYPNVHQCPAGVTRSELIPCAGSQLKAGQCRAAVNTSAAAPPVNTPHNNPPLVPAIVREICRDGISLFTCLWLISRSELLLFTLWLLLLLWCREYTLGCVHLKRDCLELGQAALLSTVVRHMLAMQELHGAECSGYYLMLVTSPSCNPTPPLWTLGYSPCLCMLNCLSGSG